MRELTDAEMDAISGGARPTAFPQEGINTAWEQQGFPTFADGKVQNAHNGTDTGNAQSGNLVAAGKLTAANSPGGGGP